VQQLPRTVTKDVLSRKKTFVAQKDALSRKRTCCRAKGRVVAQTDEAAAVEQDSSAQKDGQSSRQLSFAMGKARDNSPLQ
jgi:hypothetical protein